MLDGRPFAEQSLCFRRCTVGDNLVPGGLANCSTIDDYLACRTIEDYLACCTNEVNLATNSTIEDYLATNSTIEDYLV